MQFRNTMTFNSHDSSVTKVDGRIVVTLGVLQRCELILYTLLRRKNGARAKDLLATLHRKNKSYSLRDVHSALKRVKLFWTKRGNGRNTVYTLNPRAMEVWRSLVKQRK